MPAADVEAKPKSRKPAAIDPHADFRHPASGARARVYVGDCRDVLPALGEVRSSSVDLIFADPPFNWNRAYDQWDDSMSERDYLDFTKRWLDLCVGALAPSGSLWVNIPDDWAAEIVIHLKGDRDADNHARERLYMVNWCIWHYRFGQNCTERFINSKVHALYFSKSGLPAAEVGEDAAPAAENGANGVKRPRRAWTTEGGRTWNPTPILELSDRASIYFDARTMAKTDGMPAGKRVPMDVWYGQYWGRIQGNNKERRPGHDNQLPEAYLERVVRACSNPGDLVLDPFLGSGTTGVIAHALGRDFIGVEYSKANAERATQRIKDGPIRLGASLGQSSAIFAGRAAGEKTKAKFASVHTKVPVFPFPGPVAKAATKRRAVRRPKAKR